jgi:hypothetical protein
MARIRDLVPRDPAGALALIDAANTMGEALEFAEERTALRVEALARLGERGQAKDTAEQFLQRYPQSQYATRVHALTGARPNE